MVAASYSLVVECYNGGRDVDLLFSLPRGISDAVLLSLSLLSGVLSICASSSLGE